MENEEEDSSCSELFTNIIICAYLVNVEKQFQKWTEYMYFWLTTFCVCQCIKWSSVNTKYYENGKDQMKILKEHLFQYIIYSVY